MLHSTPDGGVAVSVLGPVSARLASGIAVNVSTEYPFGDDVTVTLTGLPGGAIAFPLYIRVPSWATAATVSVNGGAPAAVGAANGTMLRVNWAGAAGPTASITLSTNPAVRVEPWFNGALAVFRGALLYSMRLDENFANTTSAPGEPRATDWVVEQSGPGCDKPNGGSCDAPWNSAIVVADPAHPEASFSFRRTGPTPQVPFAAGLWGASNLELTAQVRTVASWGVTVGTAAPPPSSPVDCTAAGSCSDAFLATWVPFGATHLRMAELPWTAPPPCGNDVPYNASGSSTIGGAGALDFDTYAGAAVISNNADMNIRSGDPGDVSTAAWTASPRDASHNITGLHFAYQCVIRSGVPDCCIDSGANLSPPFPALPLAGTSVATAAMARRAARSWRWWRLRPAAPAGLPAPLSRCSTRRPCSATSRSTRATRATRRRRS